MSEKIKVKLYFHINELGQKIGCTSDMSLFGWPMMGTKEIEVDFPEGDMVKAEAEALRAKAINVEAGAQSKAVELRNEADRLEASLNVK